MRGSQQEGKTAARAASRSRGRGRARLRGASQRDEPSRSPGKVPTGPVASDAPAVPRLPSRETYASADPVGAPAEESEENPDLEMAAAEVEWRDCTNKGRALLCHQCNTRDDGGGRRMGKHYCWQCIANCLTVRRFLGKGVRVEADPTVGGASERERECVCCE